MRDLEIRIQEIKSSIAKLEKEKTRAELQREQAKSSFKEAATKLLDEFEVNSLDEAVVLRNKLRNAIDKGINELSDSLNYFESFQTDT